MTPQQSDLIERLRAALSAEPSTREVSMFGGRSFMVRNNMVAFALKNGDLLVRVAAERHDELTAEPGAAQAEMGSGRTMGPGWLQVTAAAIDADDGLDLWLRAAMDYNQSVTGK